MSSDHFTMHTPWTPFPLFRPVHVHRSRHIRQYLVHLDAHHIGAIAATAAAVHVNLAGQLEWHPLQIAERAAVRLLALNGRWLLVSGCRSAVAKVILHGAGRTERRIDASSRRCGRPRWRRPLCGNDDEIVASGGGGRLNGVG